jgi:hypothetical protein
LDQVAAITAPAERLGNAQEDIAVEWVIVAQDTARRHNLAALLDELVPVGVELLRREARGPRSLTPGRCCPDTEGSS